MARMPGRAYASWCYVCRTSPGFDCPDRGRSPRQVRHMLKRELRREVHDALSR